MMDREKVIKEWEAVLSRDPLDAPWDLIDDTLALLNEPEAVEPICQIIFDVPYYFCGSCKTMLNMYAVKAKYCSQCGKPVK